MKMTDTKKSAKKPVAKAWKSKPKPKPKPKPMAKRKPEIVKTDPSPYTIPAGKALMLRTCAPGMRGIMDKSQHFVWPTSGPVEAESWDPRPVCGYGLHGLQWGTGRASTLRLDDDSVWVVFEVDAADVVQVDGEKHKAPRGNVIYAGTRDEAVALIMRHAPANTACVFAKVIGGYSSTLTGGDYSTLTGGYSSTLTGGDYSTLIFKYWDGASSRYRVVVAEVGVDGIEANVAYRLGDDRKVAKAK